ncbi:hypothetical protein [Spirosoma pollinicola]|uniref:Uncharacterized protein n=1 Tax=Spirosoma pollinicola TaxID=2057025 RepID=A0A2K8ZAM4_9BACT|nr:hypothetical protein [Spirosoma pollinicola]AUD06926.1 hypothetical protein CWM47_36860 [Spirosoma pollinicola]
MPRKQPDFRYQAGENGSLRTGPCTRQSDPEKASKPKPARRQTLIRRAFPPSLPANERAVGLPGKNGYGIVKPNKRLSFLPTLAIIYSTDADKYPNQKLGSYKSGQLDL